MSMPFAHRLGRLRPPRELGLYHRFVLHFGATAGLLILTLILLVPTTLPTEEVLRITVLLLCGAGIVLLLLGGRALSRSVAQPLDGLSRALSRVAVGDLDQPVEENLIGELGTLAQSFNKMQADLKRSRTAIDCFNEHLENVVRRRTTALALKAHDLEQAYAELQELDRLKQDFLSNVSHELRTPLTSIRSFTEILRESGQPVDEIEREDILELVSLQVDHLTRLINDLLDFSRMTTHGFECRLEPTLPTPLIRSSVDTIRGLAEVAGVQVSQAIAAPLPPIQVDGGRIHQVLVNLLDNAIKFTPQGGAITVAASVSGRRHAAFAAGAVGRPAGRFPGVCSDAAEVPEYLVVSVRDTGPGVHPEDRHRIFEKFVQGGDVLTQKPKGLGLGLAICGSIVVQHGGALWVEAAPGTGSVFSFSIPVPDQAAPVRATVPPPDVADELVGDPPAAASVGAPLGSS